MHPIQSFSLNAESSVFLCPRHTKPIASRAPIKNPKVYFRHCFLYNRQNYFLWRGADRAACHDFERMRLVDRLLRIIENNARLSLEELAAMTGETPEAVAARLDEYRQKGVIRGSRTLVDWARVGGNGVHAMIDVRVSPENDYGFDEIAEKIASLDAVDAVMLMSGGYDLGVDVRGESFEDVALFVSQRLAPLSGVLSTVTHFVLKIYKKSGALYGFEQQDEREGVNGR